MRFWLDLGVDGFRVDAVYWMAKEPLLSDDDMNPNYVEGEDLLYNAVLHNNSRGWPAVYAYLSEMADTLHEEDYRERQPFMVTEAYPERDNPLGGYLAFYVGMDPKVAAPFNFEGVNLPWRANEWRRFLRAFHTALPQFSPHCVASYAFGNHDQPRLASRLGDAAARSAAVMLLTLPGMAFIYYGEELGMKDVDIPPEMVQDPAALGDPKHGIGRDPQRTPFQWSNEKHAGFSKGKYTWLPVAPDYKHVNIEAEKKDPGSYLSLYRLLCAIRNKTPALQRGHVEIIDVSHPEVVGYLCSYEKDSYLVLINFSGEPVNCQVRNIAARTLIVSSDPQTALTEVKGPEFALAPHEAALFQAEKQ
jgi:alpha-glucosidase